MRAPSAALSRATPRADSAARRTTERFYRPELDGLRFLAFSAVFAHHALPQSAETYTTKGVPSPIAELLAAAVRAGGYGVDLFFILSAFLITELLLREYETTGEVNVRAFLVRRALRIWPLFFVFVGASLALDRLLGRAGLTGEYLAAFLALAGNWACAFGGYPDSVAAPLWSVSIEEQFYLTFPVLFARLGPGRLRALALSLLALGAASRVVTAFGGRAHPVIWCSTLCRIDTIGAGILLAVLLRARRSWCPSAGVRAGLGLAGVALWVMVERLAPVTRQDLIGISVGYPLVYLGSVAIVAAVMGSGNTALASVPMVALGRVSYGLYVFHVLAIGIVVHLMTGARGLVASRPVAIALSFALTIALAFSSYRILEAPFLSLKKRFTVVPSRD